ncbi:hypothetical protein RPN226_gp128 [Escherichia phage vB_EcoM-RPN226]|nr:hypothetical protein RPN226_gp128 [Escherichia phage vB_EcoM-RPN226]
MKTINLNATVKTKCFNGKYDETMWFLMAVEGDIIEVAIQNRGFRDALQASKGKVLKHSMASCLTKDDTILTEAEFIDVLNLLRDSL